MNSCLLVLLCPSSVVMETPLKRREIPADSPTEEMRKYEDQIATQLCYAERANNERDERNSCIFSHSRKKIRLIFTIFKNFDYTYLLTSLFKDGNEFSRKFLSPSALFVRISTDCWCSLCSIDFQTSANGYTSQDIAFVGIHTCIRISS